MRLEIDQEACPAEDCLHSLDDDAVAWCIHECSDCDSALLVCWECSEAEESGGWMCEKCVDPGGFFTPPCRPLWRLTRHPRHRRVFCEINLPPHVGG